MEDRILFLITADGRCAELSAEETVPPETLAALLHTDVTERLRLSASPAGALCYVIDARGGEKELPANFCGTCFYHTGCPIFGDLLLAKAPADNADETVRGLTAAEAEAIRGWLKAMFPDFLTTT